MLLSQVKYKDGTGVVAREAGATGRIIKGVMSVYDLALAAAETDSSLADKVKKQGFGEEIDLERAYANGEVLAPINHRNAANLHLTGTGLTHLGSAATRDAMHKNLKDQDKETLTDSMKIFRMGLEGGKPKPGEVGV